METHLTLMAIYLVIVIVQIEITSAAKKSKPQIKPIL